LIQLNNRNLTLSMICKNCGSENSDISIICGTCNIDLENNKSYAQNNNGNLYLANNEVLCKNCKMKNPMDALRCQGCNSPLDGSLVMVPKVKNNITNNIQKELGNIAPDPNKTQNFKNCPSCHFPNLFIAKFCGKCQQPLDENKDVAHKSIKIPVANESRNSEILNTKTINPFTDQKFEQNQKDRFMLIPFHQGIEDKNNSKHFSGDSVVLSRANLDETNNTISSKEQAEISFKKGKWFIEDKSSHKSTFLKVTKITEIKDGDIILMGNKMFAFKNDK